MSRKYFAAQDTNYTRRLAEYAVSLDFSDLPGEVVHGLVPLAEPVFDVPAHLVEVVHHDAVRFDPLGQMIIFSIIHPLNSFLD